MVLGVPPGPLPFLLSEPSGYYFGRLYDFLRLGRELRFVVGFVYHVGTAVLLAFALRGSRKAAVVAAVIFAALTVPVFTIPRSLLDSAAWATGFLNLLVVGVLIRIALREERTSVTPASR